MATRIDPPSLRSKSYELYRHELLAWREVTDLRKDKRGVAIALSLPEEDKNRIREKVFEQIKLDDLKKDDGLDTLIAFLVVISRKMTWLTVWKKLKSSKTLREKWA